MKKPSENPFTPQFSHKKNPTKKNPQSHPGAVPQRCLQSVHQGHLHVNAVQLMLLADDVFETFHSLSILHSDYESNIVTAHINITY